MQPGFYSTPRLLQRQATLQRVLQYPLHHHVLQLLLPAPRIWLVFSAPQRTPMFKSHPYHLYRRLYSLVSIQRMLGTHSLQKKAHSNLHIVLSIKTARRAPHSCETWRSSRFSCPILPCLSAAVQSLDTNSIALNSMQCVLRSVTMTRAWNLGHAIRFAVTHNHERSSFTNKDTNWT